MTSMIGGAAGIERDVADSRGYVFPEHRVLWVSVAKNACTSIKWMLAEMSAQDPAVFHARNGMSPDIAQTIHRRGLWRGVPKYGSLSDEQRAGVHPDNGWFVFGVTRDPRVRLFSAFYSKLLSRHPGYLRYREEPFYLELPRSAADVAAGFATFARFLHDHPEHQIAAQDAHFRPQADLLATSAIAYSRIYDVRELTTMVSDLHRHLNGVGYAAGPALSRANRAPLLAYQFLFDGGVREIVERLYAKDLEQFGDRWDFDSIPDVVPNWTPELFDSIAATAAAYDQIARLSGSRRRGSPASDCMPRLEHAKPRTPCLPDRPATSIGAPSVNGR